MESDQQIAETGLAVADINLQDTVRLPLEEDEREEIFHDSMTEEQLQQQLNDQINEPDTGLQRRRDWEQEKQRITEGLQQRWQAKDRTANGSENPEEIAEGGNGQYPPTHTDHEKSKHPQPIQNAETRTGPRVRRELQNLGSYNGAGMEEIETTQLNRRRRSVSIQKLRSDYDFFKQRADEAEEYLPHARTPGDEIEAKQTFRDFKHATDGMKTTGQSIIDRLVSEGRIADSNIFKSEINRRLNVVAEFRVMYGEVLSVTDTWHPGYGSQADGTENFKTPSERGSNRSHKSDTSSTRREEERRIQADLAQLKASHKQMTEEEEYARRAEDLKRQAQMAGLKAR